MDYVSWSQQKNVRITYKSNVVFGYFVKICYYLNITVYKLSLFTFSGEIHIYYSFYHATFKFFILIFKNVVIV